MAKTLNDVENGCAILMTFILLLPDCMLNKNNYQVLNLIEVSCKCRASNFEVGFSNGLFKWMKQHYFKQIDKQCKLNEFNQCNSLED